MNNQHIFNVSDLLGLRHEQDRRGTDYQPDRGQAVYTSPPSRKHYDRQETIGKTMLI